MKRWTPDWKCRLWVAALMAVCQAAAAETAEPPLVLPAEIVLGRNLQTGVVIHLGQPPRLQSPSEGEELPEDEAQRPEDKTAIRVTVRSQSPALKLALQAREPGSSSITVQLVGQNKSGYFYVQGFTDSGTATYTAEAPGFTPATGTVRFAPSGVVLIGPEHVTLEGGAQKLSLRTVALDANSNLAPLCAQLLAGGSPLTVALRNGNPSVGSVPRTGTIEVGSDTAVLDFVPIATGRTVVSLEQPPGWSLPGEMVSLDIIVRRGEEEP